MVGYLRQFAQAGSAVLLVTHDRRVAGLADQVIELRSPDVKAAESAA